MGDPTYFSIRGGANPHTRTLWGRRKTVNRKKAITQWHAFARLLGDFGVRVLVVPPDPALPGLVYPANAGFLFPLEATTPVTTKCFHLANLLPSRAGEQEVYARVLQSCGFPIGHLQARFEGEADFFPVGDRYLFTYGRIESQRFRLRVGLPPYERVYGFRSEVSALDELQQIVGERGVLPLELRNEAYYHGDTLLCAFGPNLRFLLAYLPALTPESVTRLSSVMTDEIIALSTADAALYAANSFALSTDRGHFLFVPAGVSSRLVAQIRERGVEPVTIEVSEFLRKGGGAVKCMIGDVGPDSDTGVTPVQSAFRRERDYRTLFPAERSRSEWQA